MCSGVDLFVLLTMANAEASSWPFKMDWKLVDTKENEMAIDDLIAFEEMLHKQVQEILAAPEGTSFMYKL